MSYAIVWRFEVPHEHRAAFQAAYGPDGAWAELFGKAEDFVAVELLRDADDEGVYLTIDRWNSRAAFEAFRTRFAAEYAALDARLEGLATSETRIGAFEEMEPIHRENRSG